MNEREILSDIDRAFEKLRKKNAELFHGVRSDHEGHAYNIIAKEFHTAGYKQGVKDEKKDKQLTKRGNDNGIQRT